MRWGTLERVPHTPQNFSRTNYYWWEPTFAPGSSLRLRSCMEALAIPAAVAPEGACPGRRGLALPRGRGPSQTPPSLATDSSISPGPPLLGCRHCSPEPRLNCHAPAGYRNATPSPASQGAKPHSGHLFGRDYKCRKQSNARGAGGGAPGKIKLESPPSRREGGWGDGGNKALIRQKKAGDQKSQAPLRVPQRQGLPATTPPAPPFPPTQSPKEQSSP